MKIRTCMSFRPGHPPGRVGFGSGQKKPGVFSSGPCPTRPGGRAVKLSPHPTRQPVGSGRVRVGSGRAYVKCRVPSGFFGFRVKIFSPCPARQSYRVKNFDPSPPIKLFGSGRVGLFSGGLGRVRRVGQPMPRSNTYQARRCGAMDESKSRTCMCPLMVDVARSRVITSTRRHDQGKSMSLASAKTNQSKHR